MRRVWDGVPMDVRSLPLVRELPGLRAPAPVVLEVDLTGGLVTEPPSDPISALRQRNTPSLVAVVAALREAVEDPRVVGVVLLGGGSVSAAQADELGDAVDALREAGTSTYAFASAYGELGAGTVPYALASRCAEVWLQPSGQVGLTGVSGAITLVRGVFDQVGVEPQFGQRREYKTAADLFSAREVSDANREMTTRLATSAMDHLVTVICDRRGIDQDALRGLVAQAPLSARHALEHGLVDRLGYRDELDAHLRTTHGEIELLYAHRYARRHGERAGVGRLVRRGGPQVAVVAVHGAIVEGRGRQGGPGPGGRRAGGDTVVAALRSAGESDRVKAVVLHIDSPGGSYVASDAIRRAVLQLRATGRPVVASMGDVAASGGYYAAMPADRVFALPTTITGSIGVLAGKFVVAELAQKLGVVREVIGTGPNATMFAPDVGFTEEQRARLEQWLDEVYDDFVANAAADRGMAKEVLEPLARGRVWTGADALAHGLVDEHGGRTAAVDHACRMAGLARDDADVVPWPRLGVVERIKPAESSHAPTAAVAAGFPVLPGANVETWLTAFGDALGLPTGILSLPGPIRLR